MILEITTDEQLMLQSAITAKIKRCRGSIANNIRNPSSESERQIKSREDQIKRLNHLNNLINGIEYGKEETETILQRS